MIIHLVIGYVILGAIAFLVILHKYLFSDEQFKSLPKNTQRVYKLRRYLLIPIPFIALWPIIVAFIIFLPITERRSESKKAVKEMKGFINQSKQDDFRIHGYAPRGESLGQYDTV